MVKTNENLSTTIMWLLLTAEQVEGLSAGQSASVPSVHVDNSHTSLSCQTLHWNKQYSLVL